MKKFSEFISEEVLTEAAFNKSALTKATSLIKKILEKKLSKKLYQFGFVDQVKSGGKEKYGIRYFVGDGAERQIRLNWIQGSSSDAIESLDIWNRGAAWDEPTVNISLNGLNIIKTIDLIVKVIKNPKPGIISMTESATNKGVVKKNGIWYTVEIDGKVVTKSKQKHHIKYRLNDLNKKFGIDGFIDETGEADEILVKKGRKETSLLGAEEQKKLDAKKFADPNVVFEDLQDLTSMVVAKASPSLLVTGMAGIGKTYTIEEVVHKAGLQKDVDWWGLAGSVSTYGMYQTFVKHPDGLIIFDDCDSVFKDQDSRNILKAALDSKPNRRISWVNKVTFDPNGMTQMEIEQIMEDEKRLPSYVDFTGQVIFISNLHMSKIEPAIRSRSYTIDITLSAEDVLKRLRSILDEISPETDMETKMILLEYLEENHEELTSEVNMRTYVKALGIVKSGVDRWQHLVKYYV